MTNPWFVSTVNSAGWLSRTSWLFPLRQFASFEICWGDSSESLSSSLSQSSQGRTGWHKPLSLGPISLEMTAWALILGDTMDQVWVKNAQNAAAKEKRATVFATTCQSQNALVLWEFDENKCYLHRRKTQGSHVLTMQWQDSISTITIEKLPRIVSQVLAENCKSLTLTRLTWIAWRFVCRVCKDVVLPGWIQVPTKSLRAAQYIETVQRMQERSGGKIWKKYLSRMNYITKEQKCTIGAAIEKKKMNTATISCAWLGKEQREMTEQFLIRISSVRFLEFLECWIWYPVRKGQPRLVWGEFPKGKECCR